MKWKIISPLLVFVLSLGLLQACNQPNTESHLNVGISPYQDIAMLVNFDKLGLDKKYNVTLNLVTLGWEDIVPSIASADNTLDIGFASLIEYLTKLPKLNTRKDDPVLFIYPAYVFRGGGFISFNPAVPTLTGENIKNPALVKKFFSYRIAAQKNSAFEMMLYSLARHNGIPTSQLRFTDATINDSFLAAENGSIDIAPTGLTQRTEADKRGGRLVLDMDSLRIADISGFVCKSSTLRTKRREIESLIKTWFSCVDYVLSDIDKHAGTTIAYLDRNASTHYTLEQYKKALGEEYFPRSLAEVSSALLSPSAKFSMQHICQETGKYLVEVGAAQNMPEPPKPINFAQ